MFRAILKIVREILISSQNELLVFLNEIQATNLNQRF